MVAQQAAAYRAVVANTSVRAWAQPAVVGSVACKGVAVAGGLTGSRVAQALATARKMCTDTAAEAKKVSGIMYYLSVWPVTTAVLTTLIRTAPCDLIAQLYFEKRESVDWRRFWGFMIFGGLYVGVFQYYLYAHVINVVNFTALTGIVSKTGTAVGVALWDQFMHSPLLYFPAFVLTLKIVEGIPVGDIIPAAFDKWKNEVMDVMYASCFLWLPAQIVNFYFMPPYMVVPFINAVGAVWVVWLSLQTGKAKAKAEETAIKA